jgi:hypothetical protein
MNLAATRLAGASAIAVLALGTAACGGGATTTAPAAPPASAAAAPAATAATDDDADTGADTGSDDTTVAGAKVSANTASEDEIAAALKAAGVSNPGRWAEEVVEYRPYPTDDANLTKLRDNLVKYNPGQQTTDKIVSALTT